MSRLWLAGGWTGANFDTVTAMRSNAAPVTKVGDGGELERHDDEYDHGGRGGGGGGFASGSSFDSLLQRTAGMLARRLSGDAGVSEEGSSGRSYALDRRDTL
eukprot:4293110-Prymnesium_polylepis.1